VSRTRTDRRFIPFWVLQVSELAVAVALVDLSLHVANSGLLNVAAGALALVCVVSKGPVGIVHLLPRRVHVVVVPVLCGSMALAPLVPAWRPDVSGIIVIVFVAAGLFRLATLTRTAPSPTRAGPPSDTVGPGPEPEPVPPPPHRADPPGPPTRVTVIDATATVGPAGSGGPTEDGPSAVPGARALGRKVAGAAGAASREIDRHRPAVEAQAKRTIRSAGRLVGRLTDRDGPPPDGS